MPLERDPRVGRHGPNDALLRELRALARTAGLLTPHLTSENGGLGLDHRDLAAVFCAAGYSLLGPLALNCAAPDEGNMCLLEKIASAAQRHRYLAPLAAGTTRSAFLMTEPDGGAGSDPSMLTTCAEPDGNNFRITGRKWFISGAQGAAFGIVMARTGANASMFLLPLDTPGITLERELDTFSELTPGGHWIVKLDRVCATRDDLLGELDQGFRYAQIRLAPARLTHCMRWWGAARRAQDVASAYARERQGFGKPLIEHESIGAALAQNEIDLQQTRLLIDWVAWKLDQGEPGGAESSMAKVACSESYFRIVDRCVQTLGARGVSHETPVAAIFRELRAFRIYDGPSEVHLWSLARRQQRRVD
jgi:acyl-CoA dehydrogenase